MRVCLTMIVKNEGHCIEKALRSALPLIDAYSIVDTGSTDDTKERIRAVLRDKPGQIVDAAWEGFGKARSAALRHAQPWGDYLLLLDADDYLERDKLGWILGERLGEHDLVEVSSRLENLTYARCLLVRSGAPVRFVGRTHEFLDCAWPLTTGALGGLTYVWTTSGRRRQDPVAKSQENIAALLADIKEDPQNRARWTFYLAQEYKDLGELEMAIQTYEARAAMVGWPEETWRAAYEAAHLSDIVGRKDVLARYLEAYRMRPWRIEPLVDLSWYLRTRARPEEAMLYAVAAMGTPRPEGERLFLDPSYWGWRRLQEYALLLLAYGQKAEAAEVFRRILREDVPADVRRQTETNLSYAN